MSEQGSWADVPKQGSWADVQAPPPDTRTLAQRQADSRTAFEAAAPQYGSALWSQIKQNWNKPQPAIETGMNTPETKVLSMAVPLGAGSEGLSAAEAMRAGPIPTLFRAMKERLLPSAEHAGQLFSQIKDAAADVPIDTSKAADVVQRAQELKATGSSMPKVLSDFARNQKAAAAAALPEGSEVTPFIPQGPTPMTYEVGRDFATNAGQLSGSERLAANAPMKAQVNQFYAAMRDANRAAAEKVGMGDLYDSAINEYRRAKTVEEGLAVAKKWATRAVVGAAGLKAGYSLWNQLIGK